MKIGIVSFICNSHSGSRAPIELAKALSKNNDITFFAYDFKVDHEVVRQLKNKRIKVCLFSKSTVPFIGIFADILRAAFIIRRSNLDILTTHTTLSLTIASYLSGKKLLTCYYGSQFNILKERFLPVNILINSIDSLLNILIFIKGFLIVRIPQNVVAISKFTSNECKHLYGRDCDYTYLGSYSDSLKVTKKRHPQKDVLTLLSVSRITPYKQFDKIIEVFKQLKGKNLKLLIVGSSPNPRYLDFLNKIKPKSCRILIDIKDSDLAKIYQESDIYMTADRNLFFGMPVLESASFGKPTVALNYAAANEVIVNGKSGFVVKGLAEFRNSLQALIDSSTLRAKMGQAAKQYSQKFRWDVTARNYQKILMKMMKI